MSLWMMIPLIKAANLTGQEIKDFVNKRSFLKPRKLHANFTDGLRSKNPKVTLRN